MNFKQVISGFGVFVLAAATGAGIYLAPTPKPSQEANTPVRATGGLLGLTCSGGAARLVSGNTNVTDLNEELTGLAALLVTGASTFETGEILWQTPAANGTIKAEKLASVLLPSDKFFKSSLAGVSLQATAQVEGIDDLEAGILGASYHQANAGDLRGVAINNCDWVGTSAWLIAADTAVGSANQLRLANPADNPVTVMIKAYTSSGEHLLGVSENINLAAGEIKELALDGLLPANQTISLHLSSTTGKFGATVFSNKLEGFTPRGVTFVKPADSGLTTYIPGVVLDPAPQDDSVITLDPETLPDSWLTDSRLTASLRIVNPHPDLRIARVDLIGRDGKITPLSGAENTAIPANSVLDLSLDGVSAGSYTVKVTADAPVATGVQLSFDAGAAGRDFTWISAREPLLAGGAAYNAGVGQLVVGSEQATTMIWTAYNAKGEVIETAELAVNGTAAKNLPEGTTFVQVQSETPVSAGVRVSVEQTDGKLIEWVPVIENITQSGSYQLDIKN